MKKVFNKKRIKKKQFFAQIIIFIIIISTLSGMLVSTDVYEEVKDGIVEVLCLSCLKLDPKISTDLADFTFKTAQGTNHPSYVLDNLSSGLVFLHFSEDACSGCDIMYPIVKDMFSVDFEKKSMYSANVTYQSEKIAYFYTNIDHATVKRRASFDTYDVKNLNGLPMFTIVTLGYDQGIIKPKFITLYGTLGEKTDEKRMEVLVNVLTDAKDLWNENRPGYEP